MRTTYNVNVGDIVNGRKILETNIKSYNGRRQVCQKVECLNCSKITIQPMYQLTRAKCTCMTGISKRNAYKHLKVDPDKADILDSQLAGLCAKHKSKVRRSNTRVLDFNLTMEHLRGLWEQQQGRCALTGVPLVIPKSKHDTKTSNHYQASLDRIDNSKGYINGNVRFVSSYANICKLTLSDEEFIQLCERVVATNNVRLSHAS